MPQRVKLSLLIVFVTLGIFAEFPEAHATGETYITETSPYFWTSQFNGATWSNRQVSGTTFTGNGYCAELKNPVLATTATGTTIRGDEIYTQGSVSVWTTTLATTTNGFYAFYCNGQDRWAYVRVFDGEVSFPDFQFEQQAGYDIQYGSQYNTRFTKIAFSGTSTTNIAVSYYIDSTEASTTQADKNANMVRFRYNKLPTTDFSSYAYTITDATAPTWGYGTTTGSFDLDANSIYDFTVGFSNSGTVLTGVTPFPLAYAYFRIETDGSGAIATTSAIEYYNAVRQQAFVYQPCGITEIGGCISNSVAYLFYPSNETLDRFSTLNDELAERSPFIYAYSIPTYWGLLFNTTQTQNLSIGVTTSIGAISFISKSQLEAIPLTATVRLIVGYLLWIMLAFTLYARAKNIFNTNEKPV